jgi:hypothetical protein
VKENPILMKVRRAGRLMGSIVAELQDTVFVRVQQPPVNGPHDQDVTPRNEVRADKKTQISP